MKNRIFLLLTGVFLIAIISPALGQSEEDQMDKSHDPFHLPQKKLLNHPPSGGIQVGQWHLTGIISGPSGEKLAILNDRLVSEGDKVLGGKVERIESDHIILKGIFGTKELRILPFLSEGESPE
jgi:hypothetical protein